MPKAKRTAHAKQVRVWKVLVLGLVTGGIYSWIWLWRRRQELDARKVWFGHFIWPISTVLVYASLVMAVIFSTVIFVEDEAMVIPITLAVYASALVIELLIGAWAVRHALAINKASKVCVSPWRVGLFTFLLLPIATATQQYLLNAQSAKPKKAYDALKQKTQRWMIVGIVIGIVLTIASLVQPFSSDELSNVKKAYRESRQEINKIERLSAEYDACIEALEVKYPGEEVDPEQYDAYTAEYNRCQAIYDKLQAY